MNSIGIQVLIFLLSAAIIWYCSNKLSDVVDYIDDTYNLGAAFGGTIMLSIATNLPELAIVVQGVWQKDTALATGNILGGIALQTILLSLFDFAARKNEQKPLTALIAPSVSMLQGVFLIAILAMVIMGTQFDKSKLSTNVPIVEIFIGLCWLLSIYLLHKGKKVVVQNSDARQPSQSSQAKFSKNGALFLLFLLGILILVFGYLIGTLSDSLADHFHINGIIFGATILAVVTSLPEISGGLAFVKQRNYQPIISDIFGGNTFLPVLFLIASVINHFTLLPDAGHVNIYLTALSVILVAIYLIGIVLKLNQRKWGMGIDSWFALIVYAIGIFFLTMVAS